MILETTYNKRETILQINQLVGPPYGLVQRLKMKGIGSKRMVIKAVSEEYIEYLNPGHYLTHGNIELRPTGILIHFRLKLESYAWVMPYSQLRITTEKNLTLESSGKFIVFKNGMEINASFVQRMLQFQERAKSTD